MDLSVATLMPNRSPAGGGPSRRAISRILDIARELAVTIDLDDLLQHVVDAARAVLRADHGAIMLYDASEDDFIVRVPSTNGQDGPLHGILAVPMIGLGGELIGVLQVSNKIEGAFDDEDESVLEVLAAQAAVAVQRARMLDDRALAQRVARDTKLAAEFSRALFPTVLPPIAGYDLAGSNRPATDTSGDVFDVIARPDGSVVLVIADATGHGIAPALSVTELRAMVRMGLRLGVSLDQLMVETDRQLCADLKDSGRFITGFLGHLDPKAHVLTYHAAGQGPLLHGHAASGVSEWRLASALPFGIQEQVFERPAPMCLEPGDIVVLATDGVYECSNASGVPFGMERVEEALVEASGRSATDIVSHLLTRLDRFAEGVHIADDVTVLVLVRHAVPGVGASAAK